MKSKITFLILLFSTLYVNAQVVFEDNLIIDSALYVQSPNSVFSADLDGDGDKDVLTSSYFGNKFVWLENLDGTGGDFELHTISTTVPSAWGVIAADFDGDGDMDAAVASLSGNNVAWYENTDGMGTFVVKQYMSAFKANFIMAADIDNDNDMDIVWSSQSEGELGWIKNTDGLGTFASSINIENNVTGVPGFYPADFDGNGTLDIVTGMSINDSYVLTWYKNSNGMGSFGNSLQISNLVDNISSVYAGDMDGDGDADVVVSAGSVDAISWFENTDGLGTFGPQQVLAITGQSASRVKLVDVDADGDLDVVFASNSGQKVIGWLENSDGLGNFGSEIIIAPSSGSVREIYFSDMDADGDLDFLTATTGADNIDLFKNTDGAGAFLPTNITKRIDGGRVVRAADIDGDGDKDIVAASYWDDKISWFENLDGLGNFYNTQQIISDTVNGATSVAVGDVDGDGFNDVLATSLLEDQIVWFKNTNGAGTFGAPQMIDATLNQAYRVFLSDIDNDGDLDVFGLGYQRVAWYENLDGQGNFGGQQVIVSLGNTDMTSLDFGDLDGDGDLDIALTTSYGVYYHLNTDGQGTFGQQQTVQNPFGCESVKVADLDNDGDKDIVYLGDHLNASSEPPFLRWAENNGSATFSEIHVITTLIATPQSVIVADFDNDGDLDVAASDSGNGGVVTWYKNTDGQGSFENSQQIISQSMNSPYDIVAADIDNNNTIDIVSISEYDDKIVWHKNLGIPTNNGISGTVRFDFLNDGCTDTDAVLSGLMLVATAGTTTNATFSQENGYFQLFTTEEGIVSTQITSQLPEHFSASPATFESNFTGLGNNDEINFCIVPTVAINDLSVSFYPTANEPRPGFDTAYLMIYKNVGTTQLSGSVTFTFDGSKLNFLNASEAVTSQTTNSLTFDFTALNPFETKTIDLQFNVYAPPVTNISDILIATATISPNTEDFTADDNTFSLTQIVVGSYDPNDITCLEGDQVLIENADNYLHYLIRFQNTGTASAINVRVDHVLDAKLDWTSMQLESMSHPGRVNIQNGSAVSFIFDNINLPDSTNDEPNSHGFIAFKIKPKDNVALGDIIYATADIFFDFNPAVVTNTATTEFVNVLSVAELEKNKVRVYPNPTDGILSIATTAQIATVNLYNHLGQLVLSATATSKIDISALSRGVYIMNIIDGAGTTHTLKIIKK